MKKSQSQTPLLYTVETALHAARKALQLGDQRLPLALAFSGGADSHVMVHALRRLAEPCALDLTVVHINHRLRPESGDEESFVRRLIEQEYKLPLLVYRAGERDRRQNIEAWARSVRYRLLEQGRADCGALLVATAHHQLDQAETVLFRLLCGRTARSAQSIAFLDERRKLFRPLLDAPKGWINTYCAQFELRTITDSSNADLRRTRNYIRQRLLPLIVRRINPRAASSLASAARRLNDDEMLLWSEAEALFAARRACPSAQLLSGVHPALGWRLICLLAREQLGDDALKLGYRALARAAAAVQDARQKKRKLELGLGIFCEIDREAIRFLRGRGTAALPSAPAVLLLPIPGELDLSAAGGREATLRAVLRRPSAEQCQGALAHLAANPGDSFHRAAAWFDVKELGSGPLTVRFFTPGDTVRVWKRGTRKLKKLFQEKRISPAFRGLIPVIEYQGRIIWVPGVARSAFAPVEPGADVLELVYEVNTG